MLSLSAGCVRDAGPLGTLEAAAGAGFTSVGLRLDTLGDDPNLPELAHRLRERADALGLHILDVEVARLSPGAGAPGTQGDQGTPGPLHLLAAASVLRADHLLVVLDAPSGAAPARTWASGPLRELAARAEDVGVRLALEFMPFSAVRTVAEALDLVEAGGARSIGLVVDLLHLVRGGGDAALLHTLPAELIAYAQVCDAPARGPLGSPDLAALAHEARHERLVPGDGELDLRGLVAALPPATPLTVEVQSDALTVRLPPLARARHLHERTLDALRRHPEPQPDRPHPPHTHADQERP